MKFENNWRNKSLESLEKKSWGMVPKDESSIVQRLYRLRQTPLDEFSTDDIRFMIIQEMGLPYLITLALGLLEDNLLTEGNYYEGDLLGAILKIRPVNWMDKKELWIAVENLINDRLDELRALRPKLDLDNFYGAKF